MKHSSIDPADHSNKSVSSIETRLHEDLIQGALIVRSGGGDIYRISGAGCLVYKHVKECSCLRRLPENAYRLRNSDYRCCPSVRA